MAEAILIEELTKSYGRVWGLQGLDLGVRHGEIFGFLGPNGAGKTTTIRLLLDVIHPTSGRMQVLGLDPHRDSLEIHRRIGYLPGEFLVDGRQTGRELLTYVANLRGGVPWARIADLAGRLELDLGVPIRSLSKGNRQKMGLVQAFMHEPELLILDEPTSGLDPLLQRTFLEMSLEAKAAGQTVFMSSHVLSEVQRVADRAGIIRDGRLVAVDDIDTLREKSVRQVEVVFDGEIPGEVFEALEGVEAVTVDDGVLRCRLTGRADALVKAVARYPVLTFLSEEPDLEHVFFHHYTQEGDHGAA